MGLYSAIGKILGLKAKEFKKKISFEKLIFTFAKFTNYRRNMKSMTLDRDAETKPCLFGNGFP